MEANVKKREWVKTAAIIFLAVLLVLTFFSNTILNASLPEVAAQTVTNGTINAKIRGSGTIAANETYSVTISQTRKIASVKVKTGQEVAEGDVLFVLEATESEEVKAAQDALTQAERAYEQALLTASTSDAQENREIQKAREAYNEALAIYRQYSTMDPANLTLAKAEADTELKELQRQQTALNKELADLQADPEYTQAKADVESNKAAAEAAKAELQKNNYPTNVDRSDVTVDMNNAQRKLDELNPKLAQLQIEYEVYYNILKEISNDRTDVMDEYCEDGNRYRLVQVLEQGNYLGTPITGGDGETDMVGYSKVPAGISSYEQLADWVVESNGNNNLGGYYKAQTKYNMCEMQLEYLDAVRAQQNAESSIEVFDRKIKQMESGVDALAEAVEDQQEQVDKLTSAASAADTVKSTKQALEDLVFNQSLGDTASLDLKNQREDIEKQKEQIAELTKNADEAEVTAKVPGVINEINVSAGTTVGAEEPLCTINVADRGYTIKIPVTQEQARRVSVGEQAELVNYWGGDVTATLESIAPNPESRGGKMLIFRLDGEVDPGTTLTLSIGQKSASYDALVPNSAIRTDNNGSFVLALVAKSTPLSTRYTATRVDVQELAKDDNFTAVTGISAGEFVITTSTKPIEAGTQVRLVDEQ